MDELECAQLSVILVQWCERLLLPREKMETCPRPFRAISLSLLGRQIFRQIHDNCVLASASTAHAC